MNISIETKMVKTNEIKANPKNPKKHWVEKISESIREMGYVEPIVTDENNIILSGHGRLKALIENNVGEIEVIVKRGLTEAQKERYLLLSNKIVEAGGWDYEMLAEFDESFLADVGFNSSELDQIFQEEIQEEEFDLEKELEKLNIQKIQVQKGDIYDLDGSRLMCGDSTIEGDISTLMGTECVDAVVTDPPYRLEYLKGKTRNGQSTTGFGVKKNRRYLETDSLPNNFTELWMNNVAKFANKDFSILCYENWKNIQEIWGEMEKHWKVRNMIVWFLPNRNQGYAGRNKFFSKHDIAMIGTGEEFGGLNLEPEDELFENEYQTALFAIQGKGAHWEGYKKGNGTPTDHIEFNAADEKSSGQGIIFGVKPTEILIPYIKTLTRRGQLILEPFGGSGSTLVASIMMGRRCYLTVNYEIR